MKLSLAARFKLPADGLAGCLVGRAWLPGAAAGPSVIVVRSEGVFDISSSFATTSDLFDDSAPAASVRRAAGVRIGSLEELVANSGHDRRADRPWLLAPFDLQAIKAAGVTFAASLLERVVEEQARGDPAAAEGIRKALNSEIGADLSAVKPGSADAERLRKALKARGLWSQYLEVGIGEDPEVFTKAQPLSAVGFGADVGIHPRSAWNNPEPEVVLAVSSRGDIVGASLGNDVNLRDFEGRSALLLGKAKDNNASAAIGPFVRLFDETYSLDDVRASEVQLRVEGEDGFEITGASSMSRISRDVTELVDAMMGDHHQYPDGAALYLGTMFAPTQDRGAPGSGFTHALGDVVTVYSDGLGTLVNRVGYCNCVEPWTFGARALMRNLSRRGLLANA